MKNPKASFLMEIMPKFKLERLEEDTDCLTNKGWQGWANKIIGSQEKSLRREFQSCYSCPGKEIRGRERKGSCLNRENGVVGEQYKRRAARRSGGVPHPRWRQPCSRKHH